MPKGISVHVGVNHTLAAEISAPPLKGCVKDAQEMHRLARAGGYDGPEPLVEEGAMFDAVIFEIKKAAAALREEGNSFLFTFSGHGTRRAAQDFSETDSKDETLVLRDKLLVDNVFRRLLWPEFAAGVHCVAISDSCFSGGSFLLPTGDEALALNAVGAFAGEGTMNVTGKSLLKVDGCSSVMRGTLTPEEEDEFSVNRDATFEKTISLAQTRTHYRELETFYKEIRDSLPTQPPPILASLTLIGACDQNLTALDGEPNSFFTEHLLKAFEQNHQLTFEQLIKQLQTELELSPRRPTLDFAGRPLPAVFATKPAFTV